MPRSPESSPTKECWHPLIAATLAYVVGALNFHRRSINIAGPVVQQASIRQPEQIQPSRRPTSSATLKVALGIGLCLLLARDCQINFGSIKSADCKS